eukprot:GHRQ01035442.1.p1 GENE.GHRQ01035442.1~~GHRQ01035442.1.p1  ORF type:complete len:187 (+),score=93.84 GHRQ01035442.1:211-771(+)
MDGALSLALTGGLQLWPGGWQVFKQLLSEGKHGSATASSTGAAAAANSTLNNTSSSKAADTSPDSNGSSIKALQEQMRKLQLQVKQRDSEIAIMIGMVKGKSSSIAQVGAVAAAAGAGAAAAGSGASVGSAAAADSSSSDSGQVLSALLDARLLADRHAAFEVFRKSYRQGEVRHPSSRGVLPKLS